MSYYFDMTRGITDLCSSLITKFVNAIRREKERKREKEGIYFIAKSKCRLLAPQCGITSRYYLGKIQLVMRQTYMPWQIFFKYRKFKYPNGSLRRQNRCALRKKFNKLFVILPQRKKNLEKERHSSIILKTFPINDLIALGRTLGASNI